MPIESKKDENNNNVVELILWHFYSPLHLLGQLFPPPLPLQRTPLASSTLHVPSSPVPLSVASVPPPIKSYTVVLSLANGPIINYKWHYVYLFDFMDSLLFKLLFPFFFF